MNTLTSIKTKDLELKILLFL